MNTPEKSDVTALNHADIRRRNWDRMHVIADRRLPFMLGDARVRSRGGESVVIRSQVFG
jgi:hypothetical protein